MSSPTKEIREALGSLTLQGSSHFNKLGGNTATNTHPRSIKNHLHVPQFLHNKDFDKENQNSSVVYEIDFGDDTVVHNKDSRDASMAQWLKVKKETEAKKRQIQKPQLVKSYDHITDDDDSEEDENVRLPSNTTWEEIKRDYNINNRDLYDETMQRTETEGESHRDDSSDAYSKSMNNTDYSFQESNSFRIISDEHTLGTAKVTSYRSKVEDSPMPHPKLIRAFDDKTYTIPKPQPTQEYELELITPMDEGMVFDNKTRMWVYPHQSTKRVYDYELKLDDEDEEEETLNQTTQDAMTRSTIDQRHVTNVSNLELSFSESRKTLIAALQDVLKTKDNWDQITSVDISGKNLRTVKCLEEFVPNLKIVNLNDNALTSLEGLSALLQTAWLKNNSISDQFLNFDKYQCMQRLDLSHNKISRLSLFASLENLRSLNLSHCGVESLVSLPSLIELDLSQNKISGSVDLEHLHFPNLQTLNLSGNKISEVNMDGENLRIVNLERNALKSLAVKKRLTKMKKLLLSENPDLPLLKLGANMKQLRVLSISGSTQVYGRFPELLSLSIHKGDKLHALDNDRFDVSEHLQEIAARSCSLEFSDLQELHTRFPHLKKFDLSDNQIDCKFTQLVDFFSEFGRVTHLSLEHNPVTEQLKSTELRQAYDLMIYKLTHE